MRKEPQREFRSNGKIFPKKTKLFTLESLVSDLQVIAPLWNHSQFPQLPFGRVTSVGERPPGERNAGWAVPRLALCGAGHVGGRVLSSKLKLFTQERVGPFKQ